MEEPRIRIKDLKLRALRRNLDELLQEKRNDLAKRTYNKYYRDIAENWGDIDALREIKEKLEKSNKRIAYKFDEDLFEEPRERNRNTIKSSQSNKKKFRTTLVEREYINENNVTELNSLNLIYHAIPFIKQTIAKYINVKVSFHFNLVFLKKKTGTFENITHSPKSLSFLNGEGIKEVLANLKSELKTFIEEVEMSASELVFVSLEKMYVNISKYRAYRGGSYLELDDYLKNKKCCINIKNDDDKCLQWCIIYHFKKDIITKDPQRITKYKPYENMFDFSSIKFPTPLRDIKKVEEIINKGINVFIYDKETKNVLPTSITQRRDDDVINLLLIKEGDKQHFVYVKKLDILISQPKFDEDGKHANKVMYPCPNCLHRFTTQTLLDKHREDGCDLFEPQKIEYPTKKFNEATKEYEMPTIKFVNHANKFKQPVVIYADFETICQKIEHTHDSNKSSSTKFIKQVPCGFCFNVVSDYSQLNLGMEFYRGENAVQKFLKKLMDYGDKVKEILETNNPMIITEEQEKEFLKCKTCHICNEKITDKNDKVRDHDHITGLYRGCAHNSCNLNLNHKNYKIPVYFHNLKGFDGHLIIKELGNMNIGNIKIIAQNFEKYVTFSFKNFQFLDSFAFLSSSLDTLATNLLKDGKNNFIHTLNQQLNEQQQKLILQKGVYPYEYMDCFEKFNETELPSIKAFYSTLNESNISEKEYNHAQNVWKTFNIKNLGEYHDLYLKTDVLLLSDVFENFRKIALKHYGLDPCCKKYLTLPSFAWDAMLKKTGIVLDQLTDPDMYLFCEKGLRGGISMISHRYAKANNKYMKKYNPNDESSYIVYLDANNLYGLAMVQKLPFGEFQWYDFDDTIPYNQLIDSLDADGDDGYYVECDLHYPQHLHDIHNSYPLAPEKKVIYKSELSPYQLNQLETHNEKHNEKIEKLVPNFYDKEKYVCHIRNLKYYIEKGLVVTKIHRILQFKQSHWLKSYIDFNTEQRAKSKNDFEKDFFKLMNNAVFGKTMENMRNRVDIQLHTDEKKILKQIAKPQYETHKIYQTDKLVAIKQTKAVVKLNKPIYVGLSVLDLSKLHMYKFHYDYILPKYQNNQQLLFTDTDSLCYKIECEDFYEDMKKDAHLYDLTNCKQLGLFKDETDGVPIVEFCGLRSKMYSILTDNGKEKKTGKGIKKSALKAKVRHENYRNCLLRHEKEYQRQLISFNNMRSTNHTIHAYKFTKTGLSCSNDKQYLLDDGISSLSYGHYRLSK